MSHEVVSSGWWLGGRLQVSGFRGQETEHYPLHCHPGPVPGSVFHTKNNGLYPPARRPGLKAKNRLRYTIMAPE